MDLLIWTNFLSVIAVSVIKQIDPVISTNSRNTQAMVRDLCLVFVGVHVGTIVAELFSGGHKVLSESL